MEIRYGLPTTAYANGSVTGPKLASTAVKLLPASGRNGAGTMTVTGAVSTDTLVRVINMTSGADVTADFSTVGTGTLTQTTSTDYSAAKMLVHLKPAS